MDAKNPAADDRNPGTVERPFKTIQAALDKAAPGDSVEVRGGVYCESARFNRSGTNDGGAIFDRSFDLNSIKWITLEAYKDEHVVMDGAVPVPADKWELAKGCKNTYVTPFPLTEQWEPSLVLEGEGMIKAILDPKEMNRPVRIMPGDGVNDKGMFYDVKQQKLYVNLGGHAPGKEGPIRVVKLNMGVSARLQSYARIRKLEIRNFSDIGIDLCRSREFLVEDNYVHHCHSFVFGQPTTGGIIRRNTFAHTSTGGGFGFNYAHGTIIEGNVIQDFHAECGWMGGGVVCNNALGLVIRNNIFVGDDAVTGAAVWPDCGAFGISIYGNTIYRIGFCGLYIEADSQGTSLFWNTVFDCRYQGICLRTNRSNTCFENYVFNNRQGGIGVSWCATSMANVLMHNWVIDNDGPAAFLSEVEAMKFPPPDSAKPGNYREVKFNPEPSKTTFQVLDHNVYKLRPDGALFRYQDKSYKDLASVRSELGQEMHGQVVKEFDPASLGLVTFRVAGTKKSWQPVPMFGNPHSVRSATSMPLEEARISGRRARSAGSKTAAGSGVPSTSPAAPPAGRELYAVARGMGH